MASWRIWRFRTDRDLYDTLNGAICGPKDIQGGVALDGLTLVIDAGAGDKTVTFAPALGRNWTPEEIITQIEAADASLVGAAKLNRSQGSVRGVNPTYLRLGKDDGTVVKVDATSTGADLFGWPAATDVTGVPYIFNDVKSIYMNDNKTWYAVTYK